MMILFFFCSLVQAQIEGKWLTADKEGLVEILKQGDTYIGVALDGKENPKTKGFDIYNPDTNLRTRPLKNLTIMTGLKKVNDKLFEDGKIYDPNSGNTYLCKIEVLSSDKIKLKGFIFVPLFGRSEEWTRAPADFKGWEH